MTRDPRLGDALEDWRGALSRVRSAIRGLREKDLDLRGGSDGWSVRETIHHLLEANLVASTMIIAALATDGGYFDWTWVNPDRSWMRRVGYDRADVRPAIETLRALARGVSSLVAGRRGALARKVRLSDAPGANRYVMTVAQILRQETTHANEHIADVRATLRARVRPR